MKLRRRWARLLALFQQKRADRELRSELEAHLELAELEARQRGLSPREAKRRARLELGGVERIREEHREARSSLWLEHVMFDARYALRSLRRTPVFAVTVVAVLALGLGASVAMFSVVDELFLEKLPFSEPDRIVRLWKVPFPGAINASATLDFVDWKERSGSFEALAAHSGTSATLTGLGDPQRMRGRQVTADYFRIFGVEPLYGRGFLVDEDLPGSEPVVLLSHAAWRARFGADPDVLGRQLTLDRVSHEVIGILPPGVWDRGRAEYWKPLVFTEELRTRGFMWLNVVGRLRDGVTLEQAQEEMAVVDAEVAALAPTWRRDWGLLVEPYETRVLEPSAGRSVLVAFVAVLLLLIIACANVTNLLLARGSARREQFLLRAALGATAGRLLTQQVVEVLSIFGLGGALAALLASVGVRSLEPLLADSLPETAQLGVDWSAFGFGLLLLAGSALLVVLLPAHQLSRQLKRDGAHARVRGASAVGVRTGLVIAEVAGSLILVCVALLLAKSLLRLHDIDAGVVTENVLSVTIDLPLQGYREPEDATRFASEVLNEVRSQAGVRAAALATALPMRAVDEGQGLLPLSGSGGLSVGYKRVSEGYFEALDIGLREGRTFDSRDVAGATPVGIINEELAKRIAAELEIDDPVGATVNISTPYYVEKGGELVATRIVGVIRSEHAAALAEANDAVVYVPLPQVPKRSLELLVRTEFESDQGARILRSAIAAVDPLLAFGQATTLEEVRRGGLQTPGRLTGAIAVFAGAAALLAGLGIFGLLSYAVAQERRQIGVRMALGADPSKVLLMVLRGGVRLVLWGSALGLVGTVLATRTLRSVLFGVSTLDPAVLAMALIATVVLGLVAGLVPAWRAARLDPVRALRSEG
ncbi:MAG: ADOP family duplicated permease [Acidobacteriota bacterium]